MSLDESELERTVCFCHCVSRRQILEAIQAGAKDLYSIQVETGASTGCGGCEWDVLELLEESKSSSEAQAAATKKAASGE